ncbi:response regulator transcription factor [Streptomyces poonensis]|uniref:Sensory transduction protein RegX3 n=1 Tax=Streptomyces poonensis TaxID=68255 RepID=A0A918PT95_9ACTN|nr:response regulator transcription factor [Streptomyces poonensis]GGZ21192.1 transcriptional regulatory protein ChvI [Streptomyces poonensis]
MNVLIVEDDDGIAEALERVLERHGYQPHRVGTGTEALEWFEQAHLVLLDLGLPDLDGQEVCRRIRESSCVPVITLSGRTEELDRVMALHVGADDFVMKPFSHYELVARIQALLRRAARCVLHGSGPVRAGATPVISPAAPSNPAPARTTTATRPTAEQGQPGPGSLRAGSLEVDPRTRKVFLDGREVRITRKEFDLLLVLMEDPGSVLERQDLMSRVWDENWCGSSRTLDVHVGSLRSKLGSPAWIETVRGVGYRLTAPATAPA